jgi:hypothetical protein
MDKMTENEAIKHLKNFNELPRKKRGFRPCVVFEVNTREFYVGVMPDKHLLFWLDVEDSTKVKSRFHPQSGVQSECKNYQRFYTKNNVTYSAGPGRLYQEDQLFFELVIWGVNEIESIRNINREIFCENIKVEDVINYTSIPDWAITTWGVRV